uniref:Uncharacterized protein n=1 Tax=Physcomitrium patens TaxID=3218 RepID=A0A2K1L6V4_PHYPA|nr:hypothetical protein PHYPA_000193 [Physcomitrium patens]
MVEPEACDRRWGRRAAEVVARNGKVGVSTATPPKSASTPQVPPSVSTERFLCSSCATSA